MIRIPRTLLVAGIFASLCMLSVACKKDGGGGSKAAGSAMSYLPKDSSFVVGINFDKVRSSPAYKEFKGKIEKETSTEAKKIKDACGIDIMNDAGSIIVAVGADPEKEEDMFVVLTGSFTKENVNKCVETMKGKGEKVDMKEDGKYTAYTFEGETTYVWWASDNTIVTSPGAKTGDVLKKVSEGGPSVKDNADVMALVEKADKGAMIWGAGVVPDNPMVAASMGSLGATPKSGYGSLNLPGSFEGKVGLIFADEAGAKKAHDTLKGQLDEAKSQPMVGAYLGGVKISQSGSEFKGSIKLSADDVKTLISMAKSFGM